MKTVRITDSFRALFPDARIALVCLEDIDNTVTHPDIETGLKLANEQAERHLVKEVFSENPAVAVWREAFRKFKTKKGVRSSIESLLKRVEKGNPVGPINPLVDIYNAISLEYGLPCGGEDIDTIEGDLLLTVAEGGESFLALGDETEDPALPGEVVYRDDVGIVCRCWNWRDGVRSMLTVGSVCAVRVLDSVDPARNDDLSAAVEELAARCTQFLGGTARTAILGGSPDEFILL